MLQIIRDILKHDDDTTEMCFLFANQVRLEPMSKCMWNEKCRFKQTLEIMNTTILQFFHISLCS